MEYIDNKLLYKKLIKILFFNKINIVIYLLLFFIYINNNAFSENFFSDNFHEHDKWTFITDNVMGGVSKGSLNFFKSKDDIIAHMSGEVSTKNNGGFIQIRRELKNINLTKLESISFLAKGNNEEYFLHIRTKKTILPWQYYSVKFFVNDKFSEFILPIANFKKSNFLLPSKVLSKDIKSIAFVAYGKNFTADLFIKSINFNY
tara:strand:+ start:119 stop:727 length:609 start_codon:yes stop_codon:yes gene_type:complete